MSVISARVLSTHIDEWRVFDCRHSLASHEAGRDLYAAGHVPGAIHLHCDEALSGPMDGTNGRHPLPDPDRFAQTLAAYGVTRKTPVAAYDDSGGMFSGRLWWLLKWLGHEGPIAVLDGGFAYWQSHGFPLEMRTPKHAPVDPYPYQISLPVVDTDEVLARYRSPDFLLLDARAPERFTGEREPVDAVAGHIPGSRNRFYKDNLGPDGLMKPVEVLRQEFLSVLGGFGPDTVVHTGGSGLTACFNTLAMEMAGLTGSRIYVGSWSAWFSDPSRPIETGPAQR